MKLGDGAKTGFDLDQAAMVLRHHADENIATAEINCNFIETG
jgi:hypothetical protein